jgi:AraC-like DNA-binding protein/ABC-type Fe3+-citrate transport system substrate-binding protein
MRVIVKEEPYSRSKYSVHFLDSIHKRQYLKENKLQFNRFPVSMLCFIVEGSGTLLIGKKQMDFEPLQLYFIARGMPVEVSLSTERLELYTLTFEQFTGSASMRKRGSIHLNNEPPDLFAPGNVRIRKSKQIFTRIKRIYEESHKQPDDRSIHLQFQELLHLIWLDDSEYPQQKSTHRGIEQVAEYMQAHFHDKLDMKTLSGMANLTPSSFSRLFKKMLQDSPIEYLTRLRMESAKELLAQKTRRVKDVSAAVGYDDEFHFSRIFHRSVGISPVFYMKRSRLKVAVASCLQLQHSLMSLGVEPVAIVNFCKYPGMGETEYEQLLTRQWEELVRASPDVIISDKYHQKFYDQLCKITPTVMLASDGDWSVNYRKMAEMLGRHQEAEQTLQQLTMRISGAKGLLHRQMEQKSVCVMQVSHQSIRIQGVVDHPLNELLFRELGLQPGRSVPLSAKMLELPPEWLPPLEADYLFILKKHARTGSEYVYERLCGTYEWNSIHAVKTNKVNFVPQWLRMSWTPFGRNTIIDELLKMTGTLTEEREGIGT